MWEFAEQIKILEEGLGENEYIVGNKFSMADIMVVHTIMWAQKFEVPIGSEKLEEYAERIKKREAHKRVIARYEENKKA